MRLDGFCAIGTGALVTRFELLSLDRDLDLTWDLMVIFGARTAPPAEAVFVWALGDYEESLERVRFMGMVIWVMPRGDTEVLLWLCWVARALMFWKFFWELRLWKFSRSRLRDF